jgi:gliding motility-associated lipoprotein GldJ
MIMNQSIKALLFAGAVGAFALASCGKKNKGEGYAMQVQRSDNAHKKGMFSQVTGIPYNLQDTGAVTSLKVNPYLGQPDGPNLVFIEGGRFVMGSGEEDILYTRDNRERTVSVQSFYMDMTEVANIHWLEFMEFYKQDKNKSKISKIHDGYYYDEEKTKKYNRYVEFLDSNKINKYNFKKLDTIRPEDVKRFNYEYFLVQILRPDTTVWARETAFNDSYVSNYLRYPGFRFFPVVGVSWVQAQEFCKWRTYAANEYLFEQAKKKDKDGALNEYKSSEDVPLESGVVMPDYRLPTEAEWEYAAKGMIGTQYEDENQSNGRVYPWDGHATRNPYGKQMGFFLANFKRGRGDYAGIAGKQNDAALITEWIYQYPPNDFGLYNMGGNVAEWVEDVYRPLAYEDVSDLNPVRRIGLDETRLRPSPNRSVFGDSAIHYQLGDKVKNSLIDDDSRVYKGGSWRDVAYFLSPGTRRYLDKKQSRDYIGFRCAMIMAGEKVGESRRKNKKVGGQYR